MIKFNLKYNLFFLLFLIRAYSYAQTGIISTVVSGVGATGGGVFDSFGNYYYSVNNVVKKISVTGVTTTFAGNGSSGYSGDGGPATSAQLYGAFFLAFDAYGKLYIGDCYNNVIRKVDISTGTISTFAGNGSAGYSGDGGPATSSSLRFPYGLAFDSTGNLYISDYGNGRIRKVDTNGVIHTIGGTGPGTYVNALSGDGMQADSAFIGSPCGLAMGYGRFANNLFMCANGRIRKINLTTNIISTYAGDTIGGLRGDGGTADAAGFRSTMAISFDPVGNLFICDDANNDVRVVDTSYIVHTTAGSGVAGYSGDGGRSDTARIGAAPRGIACDICGNIYINDNGNARIRKVTFGTSSPTDTPTLSIIPVPSDTVCAGTSVTYTATHTHGGTYSTYQWFVDTTVVSGAVDSFYTYSPANGDSIKCIITTWNRCSSNSYATSNTIHMVVNPIVAPTISISPTPDDTVCAGTSVTYTATVTDGGTAPAYQWKVNGANVGSGGTSYTYTPAHGDSVRCVLTSNAPCATTAVVSSNTINMVVNPVISPVITIAVSPNDTVCSGTAVSYAATITGGASSVAYQWVLNGSVVATGSGYTYTPSHGDSVRCILTLTDPCVTVSSVSSNSIYMVVMPTATPSIAITPSPDDTVCAGTSVTYTATVTDGGTAPAYQWKVNGTNVGSGGTSYTYTPAHGDSVRCVLTSNAPCATTAVVSSNTINMVVNPVVSPGITIAVSPDDTVCSGTSVGYTATVTGGASSITYQWILNGSIVGTGSTFSYTPANGDSVRCIINTTDPCATSSYATSNTVNMVVIAAVTPTIVITPNPNDTVCSVNVVTYNSTITGGGSAPAYQWYVNGAAVSTGSTYAYSPLNGDSIRCELTSNAPCATPTIVSSNTINMVVASLTHPAITLSGPAVMAVGNPVTITGAVTGAGSSYVIHWFNYGTSFATTTVPSVTYTKTFTTDSITAKIVPADFCYDSTVSAPHVVYDHNLSVSVPSPIGSPLVYPNPATTTITIEVSAISDIVFYDVVGRPILTGKIVERKTVIDIATLAGGVYMVYLTNDVTGEKMVCKLVKQ